MTPVILPVPHKQQQYESDCLAACAAMLLAYHQISISYQRIMTLLGVKWYGTPFSSLTKLAALKLNIQINQGQPDSVYPLLAAAIPVIVSIQAGELPYYAEPTDHAVVVIGLDAHYVYLNDPLMETGAIPVPQGDFALAWLAKDERYAKLEKGS